MDVIWQKKPNEGPILNFNKRLYIEKSMVFKALKNKQRIIPRNKVIWGKPPWGEKFSTSQKLKFSKSINLEIYP